MNRAISIKAVYAMSFFVSLVYIPLTITKSKAQDPIVGAWVFNQETGPNALHGVAVFNADGTFIAHDSGDLTQALPLLAPGGAFITLSSGSWEKKAKGIYILVSTNVALLRGINCTTFAPVDLASPACPLARIRVISDFIFDPGCQTAGSSRITTFHQVDDLTLALPLAPPFGPVLPLPSNRVWQKLIK